ncbi:MAG: glycosyltransferase, partial [Sulfurimonas sp.]
MSLLDIDKRVVFLGDIKDPLPYIKQAKFCINTSHQEGFSLAVLEMMHYGTLLSSKYQGYDEILQD